MKPVKKESPAKKFRRKERAEFETRDQVPKVLGKLRKIPKLRQS